MSNFHANMIKKSHHLYIDGTFLTTKEFYQLIIFMYYNEDIKKKIPGFFILVNTKEESSYNKILTTFKNLLYINNDEISMNIWTICSDFESGLVNSIKNIFTKTRHVGCLFH